MCLYAITKRIESPSMRERWAWKAFRGTPSKPVFLFRKLARRSLVQTGRWLRAEGRNIRPGCADDHTYPAGFHAFATRREARDFNFIYAAELVLKVRVRGVETVGIQSGLTCLVCREMYVPKPKGNPRGKKGAAR